MLSFCLWCLGTLALGVLTYVLYIFAVLSSMVSDKGYVTKLEWVILIAIWLLVLSSGGGTLYCAVQAVRSLF
jgi:hypothetical protein